MGPNATGALAARFAAAVERGGTSGRAAVIILLRETEADESLEPSYRNRRQRLFATGERGQAR